MEVSESCTERVNGAFEVQFFSGLLLGANWQLFRLKGLSNVHILFCLPKIQVLLICNENKEISVANLMIK